MFTRWFSILFLFTCLTISTAFAQTHFMQSKPENFTVIGFRFMKPELDIKHWLVEKPEYSFFTGSYDLYISTPLSSVTSLLFSFPFTNETEIYKLRKKESPEVKLGNSFIGIQYQLNDKEYHITLGTRFPITNDGSINEHLMSILANPIELDRVLYKTYSLYGNFGYNSLKIDDKISIAAELGGQVFYFSGDRSEYDFLLHYGLASALNVKPVRLFVEFAGIMYLFESGIDLEDRFINELTFGIVFDVGLIHPKFGYTSHLSDISNITDHSLLFEITIND